MIYNASSKIMKVFVVVLNFNGKEDTRECLQSLLMSSYENYEIVVVDNGSKNDSVAVLRGAFPGVVLLETGENLGYAGGNNVGIRYALEHGADAILVLNNDTVLHPNCLEEFVQASIKLPESVLGGRVYYYDEPDVMQHFGGMWNKKKGKFKNLPDETFAKETPQNLDFITGCALFVPRKIFETVGLFEEIFFLYYEEIDWCFRVRKLGFFCTYVPTPILWHKESRSFKNPRPPQSYFQWRNRLLFIERNLPKKEFYWWLWTKLPRRLLLVLIKRFISRDKLSYKASLAGIRDYFRRSFGKAPPWIFPS